MYNAGPPPRSHAAGADLGPWPFSETDGSKVARVAMESKQITAKEADEILQKWAAESRRVCFAVCIGGIAWHSHWVGNLRSASMDRWVLAAGHTTNMLCTGEYREILQMEDDDLLGLRFIQPNGFTAQGFEVNLFVEKLDGNDEQYAP